MPKCIFCEEDRPHVKEISWKTHSGICNDCLKELKL